MCTVHFTSFWGLRITFSPTLTPMVVVSCARPDIPFPKFLTRVLAMPWAYVLMYSLVQTNTTGLAPHLLHQVLAIYTPHVCPFQSDIACNDDSLGLFQSIIELVATQNEKYAILVEGWSNSEGEAVLSISETPFAAADAATICDVTTTTTTTTPTTTTSTTLPSKFLYVSKLTLSRKKAGRRKFRLQATVNVKNEGNKKVRRAVVTVELKGFGTASCKTSKKGKCSVTLGPAKNKKAIGGEVCVLEVTQGSRVYQESENLDTCREM
eukprot:m.138718 g.138718  ORF g.138718 m.138718 type:complete len:266 (+) comp24044_c0_seq8:514-1311(+)